jgi:integrase
VPLLQPLKEKLLTFPGKNPKHYVISDTGDKPLTSRRYTTEYARFQRETGVTCTAHQLRHSFATIAFECGVPVKSVQEILGHKQLSTTMDLYTDFRQKSFDDAASNLNAFLANAQDILTTF